MEGEATGGNPEASHQQIEESAAAKRFAHKYMDGRKEHA